MAQSLKHLTLGFGSGHDLTVCGFEPRIGLHANSAEPAWDSLSLCPSPACSFVFLSLNIKKKKQKKLGLDAKGVLQRRGGENTWKDKD